jgi:DNA polymerase I-like protein with 3'-5' exonuclease and polymerase domains
MTKEAWLRYRAARRDSRLVLTVHDEIVGCAPKGHWSREMKVLKEAMESVELDVPLLSDGEYGYRWTEMKECA